MKSVLLSIQPKWCELIASGKKMIEVRKTRPKIETPFKCYIYCTLPPRDELFSHGSIREYANELIRLQNGRIVYDYGMRLVCEEGEYSRDNFLCRKIIGEFVCDDIEMFAVGILRCDDLENLACLSYSEMIDYFYKPEELDGNTLKFGYAWHISDLKIYDKPKELGEFRKPCQKKFDNTYD